MSAAWERRRILLILGIGPCSAAPCQGGLSRCGGFVLKKDAPVLQEIWDRHAKERNDGVTPGNTCPGAPSCACKGNLMRKRLGEIGRERS